jgi:uncharacterized protein (TIGR02217 family)
MPMTPVLPSRWLITIGDTADDADVFPFLPGRGFHVLKTPLLSTKKDRSVSGKERARPLWSYPLWHFRVAHEFLRDAADKLEMQRLRNFFISKLGGAVAFFYLDRDDNLVTSNSFGIGDGTTAQFQLSRTVTIGSVSFSEPVRGFNGNPTIYVNGVATTAFTVGNLGQILFDTPPASGAVLTWTGSFFFLARFEKDELDLSQLMQGIWQEGGLDFRTFKP